MRAFLILLLCLNLGVLYFLVLPAADDPEPYPPRPASDGLELVDEEAALGAATDDRPEGGQDEHLPDLDGDMEPVGDAELELRQDRVCLLADAEDDGAASDLAARIDDAGIGPARVVAEDEQVFVGYWVYIPPHDSMDAARNTMAELGDRGLSDYGYVGGDEYEHAVSLGVFSSEERSQRRQAEVEAEGFETEVGERHRVVTRYHVLVQPEDPDADLPDADWEAVDCDDYQT